MSQYPFFRSPRCTSPLPNWKSFCISSLCSGHQLRSGFIVYHHIDCPCSIHLESAAESFCSKSSALWPKAALLCPEALPRFPIFGRDQCREVYEQYHCDYEHDSKVLRFLLALIPFIFSKYSFTCMFLSFVSVLIILIFHFLSDIHPK